MKCKKAAESIAINKIIILILILLVIALFFFFYYRQGIWDYFKNLPGYTVDPKDSEVDYSKMSPDELVKYDCVQIGKIHLDYIRLGSESNPPTKLYLERQNIFIDFGKWNYLFGEKVFVGIVGKNIININPDFLDESFTSYLKYKDYLPSIAELKIINGAFILKPNVLCRTDAQNKELINQVSCVESCLVYDGECKETGNNDEVSLGGLDCKGNQECFVKNNDEKINDEDFRIEKLDVSKFAIEKQITSLLNNQEFKVSVGTRYDFDFSITYPNSFCYFIRTNKILLKSGYQAKEKGSLVSLITWTQSDDKTLEIVGIDILNNKKVLKRIKLNSEQTSNLYSGGKYITNEDFKKEVISAKKGDILYVLGTKFSFMDTGNYKIEKTDNNKIVIYKEYFGKWKIVDCNWWWFADSFNTDKLKNNLAETLVTNKCDY